MSTLHSDIFRTIECREDPKDFEINKEKIGEQYEYPEEESRNSSMIEHFHKFAYPHPFYDYKSR